MNWGIYFILTGLALTILNAGTTVTVTAKNVKVSNPRSLMTSMALATSIDAYIRDLAQWTGLWLETNNPLRPHIEEVSKGFVSNMFLEKDKQWLVLQLMAYDNNRLCRLLECIKCNGCLAHRDISWERTKNGLFWWITWHSCKVMKTWEYLGYNNKIHNPECPHQHTCTHANLL